VTFVAESIRIPSASGLSGSGTIAEVTGTSEWLELEVFDGFIVEVVLHQRSLSPLLSAPGKTTRSSLPVIFLSVDAYACRRVFLRYSLRKCVTEHRQDAG
jgi:hypothetical protein